MSLSTQSTNKANSVKLNFNLDSYNFTISNEEDNLNLIVESLKDFPRKIFELKCSFQDLQKMDKNFENFINAEKFINNGIIPDIHPIAFCNISGRRICPDIKANDNRMAGVRQSDIGIIDGTHRRMNDIDLDFIIFDFGECAI